jgi:ABC-type transport system involved in multi-copper enzyme maturation permease subunit
LGAALTIFGGLAMALNLSGRVASVGSGWAAFAIAIGISGLLFHAAFDYEVQFRRAYMLFGYMLLLMGSICFLLPLFGKPGLFGLGCLAFIMALLFIMAFLRHETDAMIAGIAKAALGFVGSISAVVGITGCSIGPENLRSSPFLAEFFVAGLFGMLFLASYLGSRGMSDDFTYKVARLALWGGLLLLTYALLRSALPPFLYAFGYIKVRPAEFFIPGGFLLMVLGTLYFVSAALVSSDSKLAILTQRELGSMFFSPIAYFVLLGFVVAGWFGYVDFVNRLSVSRNNIEPIVRNYVIDLVPVLAIIFIVPAITMRLLSEEQRSGTIEVLLTAPVDEYTIVLSKFFAGFVMYLVVWAPFGLYLLALPLSGAPAFDYRPLISFFVGLCITGAAFISMGLFFSSLSKNQIISGVLTFAGMLGLFIVAIIRERIFGQNPGSPWYQVLMHISYLYVWNPTLGGMLVPKFLLFHASSAVFWLFLTTKVLESRKWK